MNKGKRFPAEPLSREEITLLLEACSDGAWGIRNRAIVYLLWRCGLRVSELLRLRPCDIGHHTVRVVASKRGRSRTVGIDDVAGVMVALWVAVRAARGVGDDRPLVCRLDGRAIGANAMREQLKRLAMGAGLTKRVHPHGFRHTFAAVAGRQIHLVELQTALGHGSLETTERYLRSLGGGAIDAVRAVKW
jgi:integrase